MVKRTVAASFWFYIAWVVWNLVAYAAGWSPSPGPVLAAMVAALIASDPMHRIWTAQQPVR